MLRIPRQWFANVVRFRSLKPPARVGAPCKQVGEKDLGDLVDVPSGEPRVVWQRDQAICYRLGYRTAAFVSESPALLDYPAVDHGGVDEPRPHGTHYRGPLLAVMQQYRKQMIVVLRSRPLLGQHDVRQPAQP